MIVATLLRRGSLVAALLAGASLFTAMPAYAGDAVPVGASAVKLPVQPLAVTTRSWNGHKVTSPTTVLNTRFPSRGLDPMAVQVTGANPDSQLVFERQKQSHDVELPKTVANEAELMEHAHRAANYVPMLEFKTTAPSNLQPHTEVTHDPQRVAWPNTRFRVRGTTRDGQEIPHAHGIVAGVAIKNVQVYNASNDTVQAEQISGHFLPSARAWIKAKNLFVSEPTRDPKEADQGHAKIKGAEGKKLEAEKLAHDITEERTPKPGIAVNQVKINQLTADMNRLNQESTNELAEGQKLVADGEMIKVRVISVGATPANATVLTINKRLEGEGSKGEFWGRRSQSDGATGYASHEVEALPQDRLETSVEFPAVANASVGSKVTVKYRVPDHNSEHAFVMGGVKYYRVTPDEVVATHEAAK
jgi:hypothetical protein